MGTRQRIRGGRALLDYPACLGDPFRPDWSRDNCAVRSTTVTIGYRREPSGRSAWAGAGACDDHYAVVQSFIGQDGGPVESIATPHGLELVERMKADAVMGDGEDVSWYLRR